MFEIVFKNYRTSLIGVVVLAFTTWQFLEKNISWSEAVMGWGFAGGLLLAKDGQTKAEYDKDHLWEKKLDEIFARLEKIENGETRRSNGAKEKERKNG